MTRHRTIRYTLTALRRLVLIPLLAALTLATAADTPPTTAPTTQANMTKLEDTLGHSGVLFFRSAERWNEFRDRLPDPAFIPNNPALRADLVKLANGQANLVLVYETHHRRHETLALSHSDRNARPLALEFLLRWDNAIDPDPDLHTHSTTFTFVPPSLAVKVTVYSQTIDDRSRRTLEFSATLGLASGDIVDGLQAAIAAQSSSIAPGEDILLDLALHLVDPAPGGQPEILGPYPKSLWVWDSQHAQGYRNLAFFVTGPDAQTRLLRPKELKEQDKDESHPVEITADHAYHLPPPAPGTRLSLQALGLNTFAPGTYTITALYEQTAGEARAADGIRKPLWGGSITSNTVTVEVKK